LPLRVGRSSHADASSGCWEISDASFSRIKLQVGLEHLDVAVSSIGSAGLRAIKDTCKKLKYLNLEGRPDDHEDGARRPSMCGFLTTLLW